MTAKLIDADWFRKFGRNEIHYVSKEIFNIFVRLWSSLNMNSNRMGGVADDELPHLRLLSYDDGCWVAADNGSGDCWVEEFNCRSNAKAYLRNETVDLEDLFSYDAAGKAINYKDYYGAACGGC